ncbi:copper-binding protein [Methylobacterium isbiliense]|uniref:copper-binding protein n=1 Tax=Methylobacterium isbiliense TaxID=315478 RepID=UPI001EE1E522|nr:copper-binding protein [Methylobacterium isbiliense]MDN3625951.1 copper-binding protein [Methylobacterium isbiliense]
MAPASLAQTQLAYMNSVDWLRQIELLRPKQKDPNERPWVSSEVRTVDLTTNQLTVSHPPIPSINMPAMTMTLPVQDTAHLRMLKPGDKVQIQAAEVDGAVKIVNVRMQH